MPVSSDVSPNTDNLVLQTGIGKWWGPDDLDYRHLGEMAGLTFTLDATEKTHVSRMGGTRVEDFSVNEQLSATIVMTLEELTSQNFLLALLATKDDGPPIALNIGARSEIIGKFRFVGKNDVGARVQLDLDYVKIRPSQAINLLSDDWANLELTGKVNWNPTGGTDGDGAFGILLHNITDEVT